MRTMARALAKELFGAKYESVGKSLLAAGLVFAAVSAAEVSLGIAPAILRLISAVFPVGILVQLLTGRRHRETVQGMLLLPADRRGFVFAYVGVLSAHVLVTKTLPLWALLFGVGTWRPGEVAAALAGGLAACAVTAAGYGLWRTGHLLLPILWAAGLLAMLLAAGEGVAALAAAGSAGAAAGYLWFADAYVFCPMDGGGRPVRHTGCAGSVWGYLIRDLLANKNYLVNTVGLGGFAAFLPLLLERFQGFDPFPMGLALLCLNTPLCTLLSGDPDLAQALRVLPGQGRRFCRGYCGFLSVVHGAVAVLYLVSWQVCCGGRFLAHGGMALLFAVQSAVLSVCLEWKYPLRGWKTESDLWHHPRKYLVPLLLLLLAGLVTAWPPGLWGWAALLGVQCGLLGRAAGRE